MAIKQLTVIIQFLHIFSHDFVLCYRMSVSPCPSADLIHGKFDLEFEGLWAGFNKPKNTQIPTRIVKHIDVLTNMSCKLITFCIASAWMIYISCNLRLQDLAIKQSCPVQLNPAVNVIKHYLIIVCGHWTSIMDCFPATYEHHRGSYEYNEYIIWGIRRTMDLLLVVICPSHRYAIQSCHNQLF